MKRSAKLFFLVCLIGVMVLSLSVYAAPQTTLRFMWWGGEARHKVTLEAIQLYMKENPNVKVVGEYGGYSGYQQKLLTQLAGNTAPDIIQIDQPWMPDLMSRGDLFVNMHKTKEIKLSGFDKNFLKNQCEWDRKLVGLPTGLNSLIYVTNKSFMAKYKISTNTKWDWDNLIKIGTKVHQKNSKDYLLGLGVSHAGRMIKMYIKQHTGSKQWVNDNFTMGFNEASLTDAFAYYQKLVKSGTVQPLSDSILFEGKMQENPLWSEGHIGMDQDWVSSAYLFYLNGKIKADVMLPPIMGGKETGLIVRPSQLLVINKRTSNQKEAAKFVNWFLTNPKAISTLKTDRGIPAVKSGLNLLKKNNMLDPVMAKGIKLASKKAGVPENDLSNNKELITILENYIQKVGFGTLSPEKAANQLIADYQKKLAELKH